LIYFANERKKAISLSFDFVADNNNKWSNGAELYGFFIVCNPPYPIPH